VAERAGPANSHALENAFFAGRQMRVRHQKAGKESTQHGADVLPALAAAGGKPLADQSHGLSRKPGGFVAKPLSPFPGGERFGIDQLERGADSKQSGPCHVEIARRGNQGFAADG
jgi:hypothetical protein